MFSFLLWNFCEREKRAELKRGRKGGFFYFKIGSFFQNWRSDQIYTGTSTTSSTKNTVKSCSGGSNAVVSSASGLDLIHLQKSYGS